MRRALALLVLAGCAAPAAPAPPPSDGVDWIGVAPRPGARALLAAASRPASGVVPASFGAPPSPRDWSARVFHRFGFTHPVAEVRDGTLLVVLELRADRAVELARLAGVREAAWTDVDRDGAEDLVVDGRTWFWRDEERRFVGR